MFFSTAAVAPATMEQPSSSNLTKLWTHVFFGGGGGGAIGLILRYRQLQCFFSIIIITSLFSEGAGIYNNVQNQ